MKEKTFSDHADLERILDRNVPLEDVKELLGKYITERKQAEEKLRKAEIEYRSLFENMKEGMAYCKMLYDKKNQPVDFIYLDINDAFEKLTGLMRKQVLDRKVTEVIPGIKKSHPELFEIYGKVALTGQPTTFEIYFEPLRIWLDISVYCPHQGYFAVVFENITGRKQAEEEGTRLFKAIEISKEAIHIESPETVIVYANKTTYELFGYDEGELVGQSVGILNSERISDELVRQVVDTVGEKGSWEGETRNRRKDGTEFVCSATISAVKDEDGTVLNYISTQHDITERKQAEDFLKEAERKYRTLFEFLPMGLSIANLTGKVLDINPAMEQIIGYTLEEFKTANAADICANPSDREQLLKKLKQFDQVINWNVKLKRKDGTIYDGLINAAKVELGGQEVILTAIRDISQRRQMERSLRESEEKYRNLFKQSRDAIFITDRNGHIINFNQAAQKLFGYTKENARGLNAAQIFVTTTDRIKYQQNIERKGFIKDYELKLCKKDGTKIDCLLSSTVRRDADGNILGYQGIVRDITERKRNTEIVVQERNRLTSILDSMQDGVYIVDQQNNIQYVNPTLIGEFGPVDERKCYEYFHDRQEVCPWCKNKEVFKGKTVRWEWHSVKNQKTYDLIDTPLRNIDGGISKLEIFRDITERKKTEKRIKEQGKALAKKNIALKEVLEQITLEKNEIKERMQATLEKLVMPRLLRLKRNVSDPEKKQLELIEKNIQAVSSSFGKKISRREIALSPREIEVCDMIRSGLRNKGIARELGLSLKTVESFRKNIRRKLKIKNKQVNLKTYLQFL